MSELMTLRSKGKESSADALAQCTSMCECYMVLAQAQKSRKYYSVQAFPNQAVLLLQGDLCRLTSHAHTATKPPAIAPGQLHSLNTSVIQHRKHMSLMH